MLTSVVIGAVVGAVIGALVSFSLHSFLDKRRIKIEVARKLFGNRHNIGSTEFQQALNEAIIVFSNSKNVKNAVKILFDVALLQEQPRARDRKKAALINFLKSICEDLNIKPDLTDEEYIRFLETSNKNH